jgi:hypothetical protein
MTATSIARAALSKPIYNDYICDNGFTRPYSRVISAAGVVESESYRNSLGSWITLPSVLPATMRFGECVYQKHVVSLAGIVLVSPITVVTHNLNLSNVKAGYIAYDVANNNQQISFDTDNYTNNTFRLINVPPAQAGVVIDVVVTGEG